MVIDSRRFPVCGIGLKHVFREALGPTANQTNTTLLFLARITVHHDLCSRGDLKSDEHRSFILPQRVRGRVTILLFCFDVDMFGYGIFPKNAWFVGP